MVSTCTTWLVAVRIAFSHKKIHNNITITRQNVGKRCVYFIGFFIHCRATPQHCKLPRYVVISKPNFLGNVKQSSEIIWSWRNIVQFVAWSHTHHFAVVDLPCWYHQVACLHVTHVTLISHISWCRRQLAYKYIFVFCKVYWGTMQNIFCVTGPLWWKSTRYRWIPFTEVSNAEKLGVDIFFNLRLNERLSKQSWRRWFETPSCKLWRHCNVNNLAAYRVIIHLIKLRTSVTTSVYNDII